MAKIFLSYARSDGAEVATTLSNRLRSLDHDVFLDVQGIPGGVEWEKELIRQIDWCDAIVVIVTDGSNKSKYVYQEFREAEKRKKLIIPILVDETDIPPHLTIYNGFPLENKNYDALLLRLHQSLQAYPVKSPRFSSVSISLFVIIGLLGIVISLLVVNSGFLNNQQTSDDGDDAPVVQNATEETPTIRASATDTDSPSETPEEASPTDTDSPTESATDDTSSAQMVTSEEASPTDTDSPTESATLEQPDGMLLVEAGTFVYEVDETEHTIDAFWIDETEVTRSAYNACVDAGICTQPPENRVSEGDNQPINHVSFLQAQDYCDWRGARLPTEIEWVYAARGSDNRRYPWGNQFAPDYFDNVDSSHTSEVGTNPRDKSWADVLDMAGNVREWVNNSSSGDLILRGGNYEITDTNQLRLSNRVSNISGQIFDTYGFRCAMDFES